MITLVTYEAGFGEPSYSPFCVKAMWLLNAAKVKWRREDCVDPRQFPNAKLPAIRAENRIIGDTANIQTFLEERGAAFWADTNERERAVGRAFIRLAEEHLYFHLVLDRWENEKIWPIIREEYFSSVPRIIRRFVTNNIRKNTLSGLKVQGLARFTPKDRLLRAEVDFVAIVNQLGNRPFLLGDKITLPDYCVASVLSAMMASPIPTDLSKRVSQDNKLSVYVKRVAERSM